MNAALKIGLGAAGLIALTLGAAWLLPALPMPFHWLGEWVEGTRFESPQHVPMLVVYWDRGAASGSQYAARLFRDEPREWLADGWLRYDECRGREPLPLRWLGPREFEIRWPQERGGPEVAQRIRIP